MSHDDHPHNPPAWSGRHKCNQCGETQDIEWRWSCEQHGEHHGCRGSFQCEDTDACYARWATANPEVVKNLAQIREHLNRQLSPVKNESIHFELTDVKPMEPITPNLIFLDLKYGDK